jgi:hypothetical protein
VSGIFPVTLRLKESLGIYTQSDREDSYRCDLKGEGEGFSLWDTVVDGTLPYLRVPFKAIPRPTVYKRELKLLRYHSLRCLPCSLYRGIAAALSLWVGIEFSHYGRELAGPRFSL